MYRDTSEHVVNVKVHMCVNAYIRTYLAIYISMCPYLIWCPGCVQRFWLGNASNSSRRRSAASANAGQPQAYTYVFGHLYIYVPLFDLVSWVCSKILARKCFQLKPPQISNQRQRRPATVAATESKALRKTFGM